jgi:catechol 2,3-dioxygenase-like lactoylglutathione lyase family enzyme
MTTVNVRYIVRDVEEAIAFYTEHLGFEVQMHPGPGFARLARGDLRLLLNAVGGSRRGGPNDARWPSPGAWRLEPYPDRSP